MAQLFGCIWAGPIETSRSTDTWNSENGKRTLGQVTGASYIHNQWSSPSSCKKHTRSSFSGTSHIYSSCSSEEDKTFSLSPRKYLLLTKDSVPKTSVSTHRYTGSMKAGKQRILAQLDLCLLITYRETTRSKNYTVLF